MNIAKLAIQRPVLVVMMVLSIITLGAIGYLNLPVELMPNIEFPTISVSVVYPGASAEEVESLIIKPMEEQLATLEGIDTINAVARENLAVITASFKIGVEVKYAEQKTREKVDGIKSFLPEDIQDPIIQSFSFSDIPIAFYSIEADRDQTMLQEIMEDVMKPAIEQTQGVAAVYVFGGREKVVKITVNKALLQANGLNMNQISGAIKARNLSYPVGDIDGVEKNMAIRVIGEFKTIDEIGLLPVSSTTGKIVRLKDIAKVEWTLQKETGKLRVNTKPAVLMAVFKQSGVNSVETAEKVTKQINTTMKELPSDIKIKTIIDTTSRIKRSVSGVQENIVLGAILAVLIVWLFLGNFRSAIITAIALPNSIIGAFFLISLSGFSINVITLLSLSLAVGLLIDDSIVVRENIFRHIEMGMPPKEAAEKGTNEVALAVVSTTLSIMAVFLPISFLTGVIGQFFKQFGITVAFALAISLLDAFTTAPMLSAYWYKKEKESADKKGFSKFMDGITKKWNQIYDEGNRVYGEILQWALNRKKTVIVTTVLLFVGSFLLLPFMKMGFMNQNNNIVILSMQTYPGAPVEKIDGYMLEVEKFIVQQKEVQTYFASIGDTGTGFGGAGGSNTGSIMISLLPITERKVTNEQFIQKVMKYVKDTRIDAFMNVTVSQGMAGNVSGNDEMSTPILVKIFGDDLKVLEAYSAKVKKMIEETPGTASTDISYKPGKPEMVISVDPVKAEKLGMSVYEVGSTLRALVSGSDISTFRKDEKEYDINIELNESNKRITDDIRNITLTNRMGKKIPLSAVCTFKYYAGPVEIRREDKMRNVIVTASLAPGYSVIEVNGKIQKRLKEELKLPSGYRYTFGGQSEQFGELVVQMGGAMLLAVLFMYMILASLYNSFIQPLILMTSIPLAIIGAFIGILITGYQLDIFGFIGLLMVLGLVAKNGILLLDFTNKKREEGMDIREALLHAAPIRLRPILMTSFAMIFGMLPIALSMGEGAKGNESLAIVVIGGLITSTFLTLLVVPVVYEWVENKMLKRKEKKMLKQESENQHS